MGEQPEPDAADVAINIAITGDVKVKVDELEAQASNDQPEVWITVQARGSVAVSINQGTAEEIADSSRVGYVRHDG